MREKPETEHGNDEYLAAFWALTGRRAVTMGGMGMIAVAEMLAYCEMLDVDDRPQFFRMMHAADVAFLEWHSKREKHGT